jgi:hypothetical protein
LNFDKRLRHSCFRAARLKFGALNVGGIERNQINRRYQNAMDTELLHRTTSLQSNIISIHHVLGKQWFTSANTWHM